MSISREHLTPLLNHFIDKLLQWNAVHNLTGALNRESIQAQIDDSLYPIHFLQPFAVCIDIGSGAGFPALPMAFHYTDSYFYLIEPRKKRASFLENVILSLNLQNVKIIADFSYNICDIKADLITSRAVCNSNILINQSQHLLENYGRYLLFKGQDSIKECKNLTNYQLETFFYQRRIYAYLQLCFKTTN